MKNKIAGLAVLCCMALDAHAGIDASWFYDNYTKREYMVPMRDGCRLYTAVYVPADTAEAHPFLYTRTPYGCHPYGERPAALWEQDIMEPYLRAGYIMVFQDVRGRHGSEGTFENVRPFNACRKDYLTDEASDTYDTADWLLANILHNNSRIGVYGNSYSGFYALMAGASMHPAIRAVSPQAPVGDWWMGDDFHHNGALAVMDAVSFLPNFGVAAGGSAGYRTPVQGEPAEYLMTHTPADITEALGGTVPFWDEMAAHPHYDKWWKARSSLNAAQHMRAAVLVVGSTYDAEDAYGFWHIYRALRKHNPRTDVRLVVGAWAHGAWRWNNSAGILDRGAYLREPDSHDFIRRMEFPFFEYYLRGRDGSPGPRSAEIYFTGENRWRTMEEWNPDRRHVRRTLYLAAGGLLSRRSLSSGGASHYVSDPLTPVPYYHDITGWRRAEYMSASQSFLEDRGDVLQFETAVLDSAVTMAGRITACLYVTLSATDADFVVKLIDCGPEGDMMVRGEILRGRYRGNPSRPKPFVPGKVERVYYSMPDVAHTFMPGHRIRIQIHSTWFPLFDRNPQCMKDPYTVSTDDFVPCSVTVHHDRKHPSCIQYYEP